MAKLTAIQALLTQSALVYGPPKVGKTQLVGELAMHPEIKGIIWVDAEKGVATLTKLPAFAQDKITVIQLPDTRSNPVAIETCLKLIRGTKVNICEEHGVVGCATCRKNGAETADYELNALPANWVVVFDSLTQLTESAIAFITRGKPDDYKLQYDDYNDLQRLMGTFLSHVQQAGFNVVCISHEIEAQREDGTMRIVPVSGTRNASRNTAKYFGTCVYAQVKGKKHSFTSSTTGENNIVAGSRQDIRMEDKKDGTGSLIEIFRAAANSVRQSTGPAIASNVPEKEVRNTETKVAAAQGAEEPTSEQGEVIKDAVVIDTSVAEQAAETESKEQGDSVQVDHAAVMGAMTALQRIRYKREHGL